MLISNESGYCLWVDVVSVDGMNYVYWHNFTVLFGVGKLQVSTVV